MEVTIHCPPSQAFVSVEAGLNVAQGKESSMILNPVSWRRIGGAEVEVSGTERRVLQILAPVQLSRRTTEMLQTGVAFNIGLSPISDII
jgi:hypothetical protein